MSRVVFAGPSLPHRPPGDWHGFAWHGPAMQGDLYRAAQERPLCIGLIDGYFECVPAVWHKEILWAMARGVAVFGSSSMGALRAAELADFGMVGVGRVFRYLRRPLRDDSDVAVLHAPAALGFRPLTEAHVNVHFTLRRAVADGVIPRGLASRLRAISQVTFYKHRTWEVILERALHEHAPQGFVERLRSWLAGNRVDQKRRDAERLLRMMAKPLPPGSAAPSDHGFRATAAWAEATQRVWPRPPG